MGNCNSRAHGAVAGATGSAADGQMYSLAGYFASHLRAALVFVAHRVPGLSSCNRNAGNSSPKTLLLVLEADEGIPFLFSLLGKKESQASRRL